MNIAVVVGSLRTDPEERAVSGDELLVVFDVDTIGRDGRKSTVPISWRGAEADRPDDLASLRTGDDVVVSGVIARRFVGAAGFLVDVRAEAVTGGGKVRRKNAARRALSAAQEAA